MPDRDAAFDARNNDLAAFDLDDLGGGVGFDYASQVAAAAGAIHPEYAATTRSGNAGSDTIHRLREGIERFLITDINNPAGSSEAQSTIPTMWDVVKGGNPADPDTEEFHHIPGGANVLYMDGHVSFVRYPGGSGVPNEAIPCTKLVALFGRAY